MGLHIRALRSPIDLAGQIIGGAKYDLAIVAFLLTVSLCLLQFFNHSDAKRKLIEISYVSAVLLILVVSIVNISVVSYLGGPINYQWLYYSDFGMAADLHAALASIITWEVFLRIPIGIVALCTTSYVLLLIARRIQAKPRTRWTILVLITFVVGTAFISSRPYWTSYTGDQGKIANPIIYFLHSLVTRDDAPLLEMTTSVSSDDFRIMAERPSMQPTNHPIKQLEIRNVLIYVMESVPARYVQTYGGSFPVTPTIADRVDQSIQFENIYAHAPNSHKALVSILTSTYPLLSYKTLTKEMPDAELASISRELKKIGYRTGFFYSADLRYAQIGDFLNNHSFDVTKDFRSLDCATEFDSGGREFYLKHSIDDRCTVRSATDWIDSTNNQPFFAVVWTNMTHIPYYADTPEVIYSEDNEDFNRYLNALRHGDQALEFLLDSLETQGRAASTIVIVTGDHGQAFGEHGQRGHGANLYQENVHVPLVIMNSALKAGESISSVGGLIDIAPTVFDILGVRPPPFWQGTSLLAQNRTPRTYFFATWTNLQFGYRENDRKYIFNATANKCESFDLITDPAETLTDYRVGDMDCARIQERVAAWIQYQSGLTEKLSLVSEFGQ
jgi:phosphoglycerol transferase MdoB-like AlkP superfamily enzyme